MKDFFAEQATMCEKDRCLIQNEGWNENIVKNLDSHTVY